MTIIDQNIKITDLEKIILNWPTPILTFYNLAKSKITHNEYYEQTLDERFNAIKEDKILKYHKLLTIKKKYNRIPSKIKKLNKKTYCGHTRLLLTYFR